MTNPVRILGIQGQAGARMDFVAGWLGMLPGFVESHWYIDPVTRQSRGSTANVIDLRQEFDLGELLSLNYPYYTLDASAPLRFATKLHRLNPCHQTLVENSSISIYNIEADHNVDITQVSWEYIIKTYGKYEYGAWHIDSTIDTDISDHTRCAKLDSMLTDRAKNPPAIVTQSIYPNMQYSSLFKSGGSKHLCNTININVSDDFHNFWDNMLPLAQTPQEVTLWGKLWRKKDYF